MSTSDIAEVFLPLATKISNYGYPLAFVFDRYEVVDILPTIREYIEFIEKPKIRRRIRKVLKRQYRPSRKVMMLFSVFILVHKFFRIDKLIIDQKLLGRVALEFINVSVRELGFRFLVEYYTPKFEKGITLADFVAGYSKYLSTCDVCLTTGSITIFRKLDYGKS